MPDVNHCQSGLKIKSYSVKAMGISTLNLTLHPQFPQMPSSHKE